MPAFKPLLPKQAAPATGPATVAERLGAACWFVISTLLMLEMRESLDADTGGDKSDGAWRQGL